VQGTKITMGVAEDRRHGRNQRAYQVIAETAVQDITQAGPARTEEPARRNRDGGHRHPGGDGENRHLPQPSWTRSRCASTSCSHRARFKTPKCAKPCRHEKGTLQSDQFVDFRLPSGRVQANAVEIEDSGEVVRFTRGVIFDLDADEPETKK